MSGIAPEFQRAEMEAIASEIEAISRNHGRAMRQVALTAARGARSRPSLTPEQIAEIVVSEHERAQRSGYGVPMDRLT